MLKSLESVGFIKKKFWRKSVLVTKIPFILLKKTKKNRNNNIVKYYTFMLWFGAQEIFLIIINVENYILIFYK